MTGLEAVATAVASLAVGQGVWALTAFMVGRRAEIAGSWVDGREWAAARRTALARVHMGALAAGLAVWALERTLRARGQHRREVTR